MFDRVYALGQIGRIDPDDFLGKENSMMKFISAFVFGLVLAVFLQSGTALAHYDFPSCSDEKVLQKISNRFNKAEDDTWHRGLYVDSISRPHGHDRHGYEESSVYREYCHAYANLSDGRTRKVHYLIEEGLGFAGFGWNVEFCVTGLDPWRVYDGYCRTVRPQ